MVFLQGERDYERRTAVRQEVGRRHFLCSFSPFAPSRYWDGTSIPKMKADLFLLTHLGFQVTS